MPKDKINEKKEFLKERIDKIAKESFNLDQKEIAKMIIDQTDDDKLDAVWGLINQRVKTGFVFDEAPEINHNAVSYIKENEQLSFNTDKEGVIEHSLIIGENYDALKNLIAVYTDKQGKGLIDVIYIDPPYNTEKSKEEGNDYKEEVQANKFIYRDKYTRDGWLNMMNERLKLAKKLLSDNGVIFISIDDNEQAYLKVLCDDIFGEDNFVLNIVINRSSEIADTTTISMHEYVLCYAKNKDKFNDIDRAFTKEVISRGTLGNSDQTMPVITFPKGLKCLNLVDGIYKESRKKTQNDGNESLENITLLDEVIIKNGLLDKPVRMKARWRSPNDMTKFFENNCEPVEAKISGKIVDIYFKDDTFNPQIKKISHDKIKSLFLDNNKGSLTLNKLGLKDKFKYPKSPELIKYLIKNIGFEKNIIILDFFAGSGTTGQAVMELNEEDDGNRKFILVTNNENNIATKITRERLYRVIKGEGSNGETISWKYSDNKKCLSNNSLRVFDLQKEELDISQTDKAGKIKEEAEKNFKKLNKNYNSIDADIYNVLASLTPYKDKE